MSQVTYIQPDRLTRAQHGLVTTLVRLDQICQTIPDANQQHEAREIIRLIGEGVNFMNCKNQGGPNPAESAVAYDYPNYAPYREYVPPPPQQ